MKSGALGLPAYSPCSPPNEALPRSVMSAMWLGFEPLMLLLSTMKAGSSDWIIFSTLLFPIDFRSSWVYDTALPVKVFEL